MSTSSVSSFSSGSIFQNQGSETISSFKKYIRCFFSGYQPIEKVAEEFLKNAPKDVPLNQIVDLVFTESTTGKRAAFLIDGICYAHPTYSLSAFDEIRKCIVEDEAHLLTNQSVQEKLKASGLESDHDKFALCCDLAFRVNHPYIYQLAEKSIPPTAYTLNYLWENINPQDRDLDEAENIFKEGLDFAENAECLKNPSTLRHLEKAEKSGEILRNWEKIEKSFTYKLSLWADKHKGARIYVWYDSALVTQKAQQNTMKMMESISKSREVDLRLKDVRPLPRHFVFCEIHKHVPGLAHIVIDYSRPLENIEYSLHPGTPVYFRVDLLKVLIADYHMSSPEEPAKYCIVSDIDVEAMRVDQLFDRRTVQYLSSKGYVFNRIGLGNFENNFFIFNKENKDLGNKHRTAILDSIESTLNKRRSSPLDAPFRGNFIINSQTVYQRYIEVSRTDPGFLEELGEDVLMQAILPRKVAKCPGSQFNFGGSIAESFRFIGDDNVPYTRNGRSHSQSERQIPELSAWKAEPLG